MLIKIIGAIELQEPLPETGRIFKERNRISGIFLKMNAPNNRKAGARDAFVL